MVGAVVNEELQQQFTSLVCRAKLPWFKAVGSCAHGCVVFVWYPGSSYVWLADTASDVGHQRLVLLLVPTARVLPRPADQAGAIPALRPAQRVSCLILVGLGVAVIFDCVLCDLACNQ
jgi:hypothetical protein